MSSTSRIHVADELHLSFNPENYDSIVKGVIPSGTALYPKERVKKLQTEKQWQRFVLAQRLQMQEIVVKAFQALGVVKSWQADQLIKFQIAGKDLLSKAGEVTLVKIDALSKHVASTTPFKISD